VTINFAPEAEDDFAAVIGYLAERNPTAAAELGRRIFAIIDKLAANEFDGSEQMLTSGEVVRSWAVPPVRIYYRRHGDMFWVVAHEAPDLDERRSLGTRSPLRCGYG
jgi:plasmid stabilization system protein ParE